MRPRRKTLIAHLILAALFALPGFSLHAQDDGNLPLTFNEPLVVSLDPGQTATVAFEAFPGDTFEVRLTPLAAYSYTAVLVDPAQSATPLAPDAANSVLHPVDVVPQAGVYTLVLQPDSTAGDMLVLISSVEAAPVDLAFGETQVDLTDRVARFRLASPPDVSMTLLSVSGIPQPPEVSAPVPAFSLTDVATGAVILEAVSGVLPEVTTTLPGGEYLLVFEPGELPVSALVGWYAVENTPPAAPADSGSSSSDSSASSSSSGSSDSSGSSSSSAVCSVSVAGAVNIRSGPGTSYQRLGATGPGSVLPVTGRNGAGDWYEVTYNGAPGWIYNSLATVSTVGDCSAVPEVSSSGSGSPSTAVPTPTPISSPTPTITPGGPTLTPTYTPSATVTPGGPTLTPTSTYTPSATYTASYTPTQAPPTATYTPVPLPDQAAPVQPTATYTPSYTPPPPTATYTPSYTPTTPPPPPVAPPDANFNAPLNMPLDSTSSVTDFVSYPGGDIEDRVRWDISGMNPNAALSGGRARLIIAASCFGTGTQNITFFTGGQTFGCGQTLVDREVTYDSRTGQVTITAVGGEGTYVQWVLTGTATRLN